MLHISNGEVYFDHTQIKQIFFFLIIQEPPRKLHVIEVENNPLRHVRDGRCRPPVPITLAVSIGPMCVCVCVEALKTFMTT